MMGCFNIEVTSGLNLFKMETLSEPMSLEPSQHRQELVDRLDILRTSEGFCDVTIVAKGKEFKAHKAVLAAASPFFLTLLTSDMKESKEQLIKIELEEATAAVMEDVLKYVYTGKVLVTEERAHNLIATADYLLIPGLKSLAGNFLKEVVTIENCIFNYYFAEKYQCIELKEKSCQVINSSFSVVMETEDFLKLDMKQVMEWVSSDDVTVSAEEDVFKGIVKWVSHNKTEREEAFPELLHQVRLTSMSRDFVLNDLPKEELILRNPEFGLNFVVDAMKLMQSATDGQVNQQPRKCLEAHLNGIFVCGGRKALCYFPQQNMWYQLADKLFGDEGCSPTQGKGNIYVPGTCNVDGGWVMQHYIPTSNSWGAVQSDTNLSSLTCCTVCKGYLYAICLNTFFEGKIFRYDAETNCWNKVLDPPKRRYPCIVTDEQYLYIIGGALDINFNAIATTARFDFNYNKWEEVANINYSRHRAFGATMNGKVYIAGGKQGWYTLLHSCEVYTPATKEWQLMPSLKVPRCNANMVCCEGKLYVLGGETQSPRGRSQRLLTVEEFDSDRNEWVQKSVIPANSFETKEEREKDNRFQACFARLCKEVIDKLKPLN